MKIIKYNKINGNKYEVYLENNEKIKLYEDVILKEELLLKKEIDDVSKILEINSKYEIYEIALKYLNHHVISIKGMKDYLLKKNYVEEDINNTIDKLIKNGYLNDSYFAKCYINDKINLTNDGPLKIIKYLEDNNIEIEVYSEILDKDDEIWSSRIKKYLEKQVKLNKKSSYYFKNKMIVNLINLGYEKEMINSLLNNVTIDNQEELKNIEKEKIRKKLEKKYSGKELERKIKEKLYQRGFFE
jgi:regulatory protein